MHLGPSLPEAGLFLIVRNQLTELEESIQLARRKEIYEALYPEVKNGGDRGNQYTGGKVADCQNGELPKERFTENTAKQTGRKERTIQ